MLFTFFYVSLAGRDDQKTGDEGYEQQSEDGTEDVAVGPLPQQTSARLGSRRRATHRCTSRLPRPMAALHQVRCLFCRFFQVFMRVLRLQRIVCRCLHFSVTSALFQGIWLVHLHFFLFLVNQFHEETNVRGVSLHQLLSHTECMLL